jgi:Spy/CpxP family protein refolding chaperone
MRRMIRIVWLGLVAVTLAGAGTTLAQHGGHGTHGDPGTATPASPHARAEACAQEFDAVVAEGRGFGLAFAADQNGYPGPLHVLELKDRLGLTSEQETRVRALMEAMFADARPKSARLLQAEARLRALFAGGKTDEATVRTAAAEVEQARREVRLVHLLTHLQTRALLTDAQISAYTAARWGQR